MRSKIYIITIVLTVGILLFLACNTGNKNKSAIHQNVGKKIVYSCEMHPEVKVDKPGKCPKCGMELIKVSVDDTCKVQKSDSLKM